MSSYKELITLLQAPFPPGTVKEVQKGKKLTGHIHVRAYMRRLEEVAGEHWQWFVVDEPVIHFEKGVVIVKGELMVSDTKRQGIGVSTFEDIKMLKIALKTAESEALRDACDKFLMGWQDLSPYRDEGNKLGNSTKEIAKIRTGQQPVSFKEESKESEAAACLVCMQVLSRHDQEFLQEHGVKLNYCQQHVPAHFLKNKRK